MYSSSLIPFDLSDLHLLDSSVLHAPAIAVLALAAVGGLTGLAVLAGRLPGIIRRALRPHSAASGSAPC